MQSEPRREVAPAIAFCDRVFRTGVMLLEPVLKVEEERKRREEVKQNGHEKHRHNHLVK